MPPEFPCCVHEPAGAAPRPAVTTPRDGAPQMDEVMQSLREVLAAGISRALASPERNRPVRRTKL